MIESHFDPQQPHPYVIYRRMSSELQNPRSPEQQSDGINRGIEQGGHHQWVHLRTFTDAAVSGRYLNKRPAFSEMMDLIRAGALKIDLILVDTLERFGRLDEVAHIRADLYRRYGVLILTADTHFADPTSIIGQVYGTVEAARTTAANRQKANDVLRGKIDVALRKRWPGGPTPRGYLLEPHTETLTTRSGKPREVFYHTLSPDPVQAAAVVRVFDAADRTGWGCTRLAGVLNSDAGFVAAYGKISAAAVGYILRNELYKGDFVFNKLATDVVDDTRITRVKPENQLVQVPGFCPPLVDPELWDRVNRAMAARSQRSSCQRAAAEGADGKRIRPLAPGISLKYPLTGLVRCGRCGLAMRPSRSGAKSTAAASYFYYTCAAARVGRCSNRLYLRGGWLWQMLVAKLRDQLFPLHSGGGSAPMWLEELVAALKPELLARCADQAARAPLLEKRIKEVDERRAGWSLSLSNSSLDRLVRQQIESEMAAALAQQQAMAAEVESLRAQASQVDQCLDLQAAIDRLRHLDQVLGAANATAMNIELARHVEAIEVFEDGRVMLRTHRLGIFEGVTELLGAPCEDNVEPVGTVTTLVPNTGNPQAPKRGRRLSRRRCTEPVAPAAVLGKTAGLVERRIKLPAKWVDQAIYQMPQLRCWARENAAEVQRYLAEHQQDNQDQVAEHFGVSRPTIRAALRAAQEGQAGEGQLVRGRGLRRTPGVGHFQQIAEESLRLLADEKLGIKEVAQRLGVCRNTVTKALRQAWAARGEVMPDGRSMRGHNRPMPSRLCPPSSVNNDGQGAPGVTSAI